MTEPRVEKHIQAARRELRVNAWDNPRVEAALRELGVRHSNERARRRRFVKLAGVAAVAALLALAGLAFFAARPGTVPGPTAGADGSAFERVSLGEATEVRFGRGTRIDVRERTEVRVVVGVEAGTAHFTVRHDPRRLFRVISGGVEVEDLGTKFEVENSGGTVRVSVSEGSVSVSLPPDTPRGERRKLTLNAGESGVYASEPRRSERRKAAATEPSAAASVESPNGATPPPAAADWRELARAGKYRQAYEILAPGGFRDVRDEPRDLLLASDVARLSQQPGDAAMLLRKLISRHERDSRAPSAAFTLGWVLMNELGRPREAAHAFARAEALAPRGNLAEDALARAVEAWYRSGELARAKAEVDRYEAAYPDGRHRSMLKRLVVKP
ncbi:MAG TPA: FecR family protein [Polyangiaceae bacterium]